MIQIIPVQTKKQLRQFIDFPHDLYQSDPHYVPELFIAQRDMLTKGKHPSHQHIDFQLFIAFSGDEVCGRIAGIYNQNHNDFVGSQDGFFGFFDVVDDFQVAQQLLDTAVEYLQSRNVKKIIGPVNFSTNDPAGLLIDGFDDAPKVMMTYNKPYYAGFLEKYGFKKQMDLLAYWLTPEMIPERVLRLAENIEQRLQRNNIIIRTINLKDFKNEIRQIKKIYNEAWDKNWGFVPLTDEEFDYVAKDMKLLMDKDFVLVAEKNGEMIGFSLTLPNINEALIKVKRGRLLPTGIFKLLWHKSKIKSLRVLTLGILEEYRTLGIEVCFYAQLMKKCRDKGYDGGEASWILENNALMIRGLKNLQGKIYKTYRLYDKSLEI